VSLAAVHDPALAAGEPGSHQYLTFTLEERTYAVPLPQVAEICVYRELNRMPHMPKGVEGLLDLRGSVIPVVNLRVRLGLPALAASASNNILVLSLAGNLIGVLVDHVDSVITATPEQHAPAGPILAGKHGAWVSGFILQEERVTVLLDTALIVAFGEDRSTRVSAQDLDLEQRLDQSLRELIAMAPEKSEAQAGKILPQMEETIGHTEAEMAKVVARIEGMLSAADNSFQSLMRLKQEAQLGRMKGQEALLAELEQNTQTIQDAVFQLLQLIQFQDIARQKLERVLNHIRGLQAAIGRKFRDPGRTA